MSILHKKNIWIGLAEIYSLNKKGQQILGGSTKGFVNAVAIARNRYDFRKRIKSGLVEMNIGLKRLEEAELFNLRIKKFEVSGDLKNLAKQIDKTNPVGFGTFFVFEK
jgi:hypothetical protein